MILRWQPVIYLFGFILLLHTHLISMEAESPYEMKLESYKKKLIENENQLNDLIKKRELIDDLYQISVLNGYIKDKEAISKEIRQEIEWLEQFVKKQKLLQQQKPEEKIEIIKNFPNVSIVIPSLDFTTNDVFEFLIALKNKQYDLFDFNELCSEKGSYMDSVIEKLNLKKLKEKLEKFDLKDFFGTLEAAKEISEKLSKNVDELIVEIIDQQKEESFRRISTCINSIYSLAKEDENRLFIVVFPEAFFNFFQNPTGMGNFIPFFDENWREIITVRSKESNNVLLFINIIYADKKRKANNFSEDFHDLTQQYVKNPLTQKQILTTYKDNLFLSVVPVFNETFVFYKGEELDHYVKQFIIDEDFSFMKNFNGHSYLSQDTLLYVPGKSTQNSISNLFAIEICQDHRSIQKKQRSNLLILQSASINIDTDLPKNYSGIFIHSDIDKAQRAVYYTNSGNLLPIESFERNLAGDLNVKIYDISKEWRMK